MIFLNLHRSGNQDKKAEKIKDIWINKNLTYKQQVYFTKKYSRYWNQDDNWKRFNRLIYEGKNVSARRVLNRISGDLRKLGEARLALSNRSPNVSYLIQQVPKISKRSRINLRKNEMEKKSKIRYRIRFVN